MNRMITRQNRRIQKCGSRGRTDNVLIPLHRIPLHELYVRDLHAFIRMYGTIKQKKTLQYLRSNARRKELCQIIKQRDITPLFFTR